MVRIIQIGSFICCTFSGYHMETLGENVRAVLQGFEEWRREKVNA